MFQLVILHFSLLGVKEVREVKEVKTILALTANRLTLTVNR